MTESPSATWHRAHGWIGKVLLVLLLLTAVAAAFAWRDYQHFASTPLPIGNDEVIFEVKKGDSLRTVVRRLARMGLTENWRQPWWQALAVETDVIRRLQVGEYALGHGVTPRSLLDKFARGRVVQHQFTIIEGWTFGQLRRALADVEGITHTLADQSDEMIMAALDAEGQHPEGWFLPETYAFTRGVTDLALLKRAHLAMKAELQAAWAKRSEATAVETPYQALILASIIEKETGKASERPEIAGVFSRRLRLGMRLQTDPTVIYGLGSAFDGNLRRRDLQADTPYNTYTREGLPPTPIALPGRDSIAAAISPADGRTLYFVSRGDGSHQFSENYRDHVNAVRRYQLGARRQVLQAESTGPAGDAGAGDDDASTP
ncbi:endolytic transglycosylase MltG [Pseudofulvimonas gallinarii]|jgi:UPF0755 protein|uniref:Endolytic murein transglycosylase n=1 Tax=Pseudofulvimonas gallinarii TaxID=634155 RepID=A0A4V2UVY7_9GAMM|nr:endolytic transglycosylase MltG [Pseudofulvimonas gallinarii]TCS97557.1 UPF0755 protein [Pseudofulvimonas gallinarii]